MIISVSRFYKNVDIIHYLSRQHNLYSVFSSEVHVNTYTLIAPHPPLKNGYPSKRRASCHIFSGVAVPCDLLTVMSLFNRFQVFKSLNLSIYDLSVDTLDVHAVSNQDI